MARYQQGIAAGHDADPGDIDLFINLDASDNEEFRPAHVMGSYSPGDPVLRANISVTFEGMKTCSLRFFKMPPTQLKFLNTTYCSGLYWGRVTLSLNLYVSDTFAPYNATIILPREVDLKGTYDPVADWYDEVEIQVLDLEAITP